jgi:hypothetical protein
MKRPRIITIICIIGYLSVLISFPQVFSPSLKRLGLFIPAIYGVLVAMSFMAYVGLWYFKQWGAALFLISFFGRIIFFIATGQIGPGLYVSAAVNCLFIFLLLRHYGKMDANL